MNKVSAQVSLYPLEQADISPPIHAVWESLRRFPIRFEPGSISTVLWGDATDVFAALEAAFDAAAAFGHAVMTVTISNACPVDGAQT